jgi:hypothetical protein
VIHSVGLKSSGILERVSEKSSYGPEV